MRLLSISLTDHVNQIKIAPIHFGDFVMLAGASGAGKTTIINALRRIIQIANGANTPGYEWCIQFEESDKHDTILWQGKFSDHTNDMSDTPDKATIEQETLQINGQTVIQRSASAFTYNAMTLPTIDRFTSAIHMLRDDDAISRIAADLRTITTVDNHSVDFTSASTNQSISPKRIMLLEDAKSQSQASLEKALEDAFTNINVREKLYLTYRFNPKKFDEIQDLYTSVFPAVKHIKPHFSYQIPVNFATERTPPRVAFCLTLANGQIIQQEDISSGMFKTLMIISELYLLPQQSVMVIDELENSLGVNCLQEVIDELVQSEHQIITSTHHPKIINGVSPEHWLIVARDAQGTIQTLKAIDVIGTKGKHEHFIQLINSEIYETGLIE